MLDRALAWMPSTGCQTQGWAGGGVLLGHTQTQTFLHTVREMYPHSHHLFYPLGNPGNRAGITLSKKLPSLTPQISALAWLLESLRLEGGLEVMGGLGSSCEPPLPFPLTPHTHKLVWQEVATGHPQGW